MIGKVNAGGGGGINLHVVGGATRPANPRDNTIWVDTSDPVTGWEVGRKRPESPLEGNVFILTDGDSSVADMEISGLSGRAAKQIVKITPSYGYQWSGTAWVAKTIKLYVNNGWLDTLTTFYDRGTYGPGITSGWTGGTDHGGYIQLQNSSAVANYSLSNGSVTLNGIKTVNIEWSGTATKPVDYDWGSHIALQIVNEAATSVLWEEDHSASYSTGLRTTSVNVSNINQVVKFRLKASGGAGTGTINLYSIKLVPGDPT